MSKYQRVTLEDRCQIQCFLQVGMSLSDIATKISKHKSTVSREIFRNRIEVYQAAKAERMAKQRFQSCRRRPKIRETVKELVSGFILDDLSPEQVSGRLKAEKEIQISHSAIYNYLSPKTEPLRRSLRRFNKGGAGRYRQRRRLRNDDKLNIRLRPMEANLRQRIGDWERDTLYANRKQLLVCVDRKTRYIKIAKLPEIKTETVSRVTLELLNSTGKPIHTITNDNGPEMRDGHKMPVAVYHCDPRRPQQRGTVENTIGLIRQYISRKTELDDISEEELKRIEDKINLRPRKCLGYKTPFEAFYDTTVALAS